MLDIGTIEMILSELKSSMSEKSFNYLELIVQDVHNTELKQLAFTVGNLLQGIPAENEQDPNKDRQSRSRNELLLANGKRTEKKIKNTTTHQISKAKKASCSFSPIYNTNLSSLKYSQGISLGGPKLGGSSSTVKLSSSTAAPTVCSKLIYKLKLGKDEQEEDIEESPGTSTQSELDYPSVSSGSTRHRHTDNKSKKQNSIYESLIGKINLEPSNISSELSSTKKTKIQLPKNPNSVVDLTNELTNPLYKSYIPEGITKSEDELGKELISSITNKFNTWLGSLEGEIKSIESKDLVKILRTELEEPDPMEVQKIERCIYSAPIQLVLNLEKKICK